MSEESQDSPVSCPKNSFGHSWKAVVVVEDRLQQREQQPRETP